MFVINTDRPEEIEPYIEISPHCFALPSRLIFHAHLLSALTSFLSLLLCLFPLEKIKLGHIFLLLLFSDLNGINSKEETELMLCCTCTGRCRCMDSSVGTGAMYDTVCIALETYLSPLSVHLVYHCADFSFLYKVHLTAAFLPATSLSTS